ncbi:MAG: SDR family oxidoreductase [Rhodospirillaceae bacterium]|jgi:3-oxoacyl-[acyl-carrier protein] reductase|nr:SDR family oxidoreductase [Rhodospirillaceae bacterium]
MGQFDGRIALITGSGSGIGRATALIMAERGADIAVLDRNMEGAEETAEKVRALGRSAKIWEADVTDFGAMAEAVKAVEGAFGKIDVLVNNAGVSSDRCPLEEVTPEMFHRSMYVHLGGAIFTTQAVIPGMKARGYGKIVNISSIQGMVGHANGATYNAAKGGVLALTKGWAREFSEWKICVNAVAPGHCLTPMPMARDTPEVLAKKAESVPFKRYGQPEEMGYAIAYLCSPEADFVTGQVISPNGGYLMVGY